MTEPQKVKYWLVLQNKALQLSKRIGNEERIKRLTRLIGEAEQTLKNYDDRDAKENPEAKKPCHKKTGVAGTADAPKGDD